ncbi:MAG: hypothetical protein PUF03_00300 [Lachnospiraceae bacterium]|nr:hypothetical protein [Lachnospiraceae bacterium]
MSREINSVKKRVAALEEENRKLRLQMSDIDARVKKNARDIESLRETDIISALQERNIPGDPNSKPRYSYQEIAEMYETNPSNVCRIAKENNIERRTKKTS